jgi:peptide/nickel transport system ATP-binding protein
VKARHALTLLYVSHDLALVGELADEVAIMFEGRIVEHGEVTRVFAEPGHPHTRDLVASLPALPGASVPPVL